VEYEEENMPATKTVRNLALPLILAMMLAAGLLRASAQSADPVQLEEGARLYAENCAVCHGQNGEGRVGATLNKDWPAIRPEVTVKTIIENGIQGSVMPAWSQRNGGPLGDADIEALLVYILSWQTGGVPDLTPRPTPTAHPPITPIPNVTGDPNQGALIFGENCAVCHGPDGEGRVGATLAKNWAGIRPDLVIKTTIERGIENSVMPAWSQANGGPLSEDQINDVVAFILSRPNVQFQPPEVSATPPYSPSWLSGWGGVVVFVGIFGLIIVVAIWVQKRDQAK
jgi:mono/diheme cytochrome c family protein